MKNYYFFLSALLVLAMLMDSCKCNEPDPIANTCPEHMKWNDTKQKCECDNLSIYNGSECVYIGIPNIGDTTSASYPNFAFPISSSCSDWRDSLVFNFGEISYTIDSNGYLNYVAQYTGFIRGTASSSAGDFTPEPDAFYPDIDGRGTDSIVDLFCQRSYLNAQNTYYFHMYMTINKNRDTIRAKICNTNSPFMPGPYPNLDSCYVTFVKIK